MDDRIIEIDYTNHRDERRIRKILPVQGMFFGSNQWHKTDQWLFNAIDMEDPEQKTKTFALAGIHGRMSPNALSCAQGSQLADRDQRITELLMANNELLERARNAEAKNTQDSAHIAQLTARIDELLKTSETKPSPAIASQLDALEEAEKAEAQPS